MFPLVIFQDRHTGRDWPCVSACKRVWSLWRRAMSPLGAGRARFHRAGPSCEWGCQQTQQLPVPVQQRGESRYSSTPEAHLVQCIPHIKGGVGLCPTRPFAARHPCSLSPAFPISLYCYCQWNGQKCCMTGSCDYLYSYILSIGYLLSAVNDDVFFGSVARECGSKKHQLVSVSELGGCDLH